MAVYCRQHAKDSMVDVRSRRYVQEDCSKVPTFGVEGSKVALNCLEHAEDGMLRIRGRDYAQQGRRK